MNEAQLRGLHDRSSHMAKEHIVADRGPTDIGIRVLVYFTDGCAYMGKPGEKTDEYKPPDEPPWAILSTSVRLLFHQHGHVAARFVMLSCEGYSRTTEDAERVPLERGDMAKDFATNPASTVTEVMSTYVVDVDGLGSVIEPYRYTDGGVLVWGEPTVWTGKEESGGVLLKMMLSLWEEVG